MDGDGRSMTAGTLQKGNSMGKIAIYPGSFNPWHEGHSDILRKALQVFDKVIISVGRNPEKTTMEYKLDLIVQDFKAECLDSRVEMWHFTGLLVDHIKKISPTFPIDAVIRGLRNGTDLQFEMNQQYWNEDLGLKVPVVYFICDRRLAHISSSTIRMVAKIKKTDRGLI